MDTTMPIQFTTERFVVDGRNEAAITAELPNGQRVYKLFNGPDIEFSMKSWQFQLISNYNS